MLLAVSVALVFATFSRVNAASTITVNSSADNLTSGNGLCTLREAITNANNNADSTSGDCAAGSGTDVIEFDITSNEGPGPHTIVPTTNMVYINDALTIDGTTETGYVANTAVAPDPFNGTMMIELAGTTPVVNSTPFTVNTDDVTIKGITANRFSDNSVTVQNNANNVIITGNYFGVGTDGVTDYGNDDFGVVIWSGSNITIGGSAAADRNIISGSGSHGINSTGITGLTVQGNYIGVGADGTTGVGNGGVGVLAVGNTSTQIGGNTATESNVISSNGQGVSIEGSGSASNVISGNRIGTNAAGTADLGNGQAGVLLDNSPGTIVGGTTSGERNVISGNDNDGIWLYGDNADDNVIQGNYIGTNAAGTGDLGNTQRGVNVTSGADRTLIGGTTSGASNLIRYNDDNGVVVVGSGSLDNVIIGNSLFGNAVPNIDLGDDGDTANDANDVDSGSNDLLNYPVWGLFNDDSGDTEVTYDLDVPAGNYRVETFSGNGRTLVDTQNITHTGSGVENFANTIIGIGHLDLRMTVTEIDGGQSSGFGPTSEYSDVYSDGSALITVNSIADDQSDDGECTLREAIVSANTNTESGSLDGECHAGALSDTIEFDIAGAGVHSIVPGSPLPAITADNITINGYSETGAVENSGDYSACFIGSIMIEIDGTNTVTDSGISINGADNTVIRGLAINNFTDDGINVTGAADSTVIAGNIIGLNYLGTIDEGNTADGIQLNGSSNTTIGGSNVADRNVISGNDQGGIYIGSTDTAVSILGNCVGPAANGTTDLGNTNDGVTVDGSDGAIVGGAASGSRNVLSGNGGDGIEVSTNADNVTILGNYIGLGSNGTTNLGNTFGGVNSGGPGTIVGGTATGSRNVISGNGGNGVSVYGATGSGTVQGNYIGYTANGLAAIANGDATTSSVSLQNNVQFGGTTTAARNYLTSGGLSNGIGIFGGTPFGGSSTGGNVVQGNCIGTNINCVVQAGFETRAGVILAFDTFNNVIGGTDIGSGNVIAGNYEGVISLSISGAGFYPLNNSIIGNNIYESTGGAIISTLVGEGIGIDLLDNPTGDFTNFSNVGVNAIDVGDADTGSNDYLNYPAIDSTSARAGELDVQFDLDVDGTAPNGYRVEFFANTTGDASGNGEGQIYLGSHNVAGDVTDEIATITISPGVITTGQYDITATATERDNSTDGFGATSEFSAFLSDQQIIQPLNNVVVAPDESSSTNNAPTGSSSQLANTGQNQAIAVMLSVVLLAGSTVIFRKLSSLKH